LTLASRPAVNFTVARFDHRHKSCRDFRVPAGLRRTNNNNGAAIGDPEL
jgi:hypothetical protein